MAKAKGTGQLFDQVQHALNGDSGDAHTLSPTTNHCLVLDSGPRLTIETVGEFAVKLRAALAEADSVAVTFPAEAELDITALQLFCSACKTAGGAGKSFIYQGPLPEALHRLAAESGAERHDQCPIDSSVCFRKIGGSSTCRS